VEAEVYSARLGAIAPQQFQAALDRFRLGRFVEAQRIESGLFGQNVFVTSTAGRWVLRGDPHYDWQFPTEEFFARLLHERTRAPVPWPYLLDPTTDIFGWEYILMPRMPGISVTHGSVRSALSVEDNLALARALGHTLADIHALEWPYPGMFDLATGDIAPLVQSWADLVEAEVHERVEGARAHSDWTTDEDIDWVAGVLAQSRCSVEEPFTPRVVLPDYKHDNTTAERDGDRWRISGVFDLMEASMGDGEASLCRQVGTYIDEQPALAPVLARAFVQTYLARRSPRPGFNERLRLYMLADRLIIWEYGQRHPELGWWKTRLSLRQYVEPYLDALPV
jgi:aminoglycoside phosphotransferase (APT) family kinase protein